MVEGQEQGFGFLEAFHPGVSTRDSAALQNKIFGAGRQAGKAIERRERLQPHIEGTCCRLHKWQEIRWCQHIQFTQELRQLLCRAYSVFQAAATR